jgi:hypothetical protein
LLCEKDALKNVAKILAQDPGKIPYVGAPTHVTLLPFFASLVSGYVALSYDGCFVMLKYVIVPSSLKLKAVSDRLQFVSAREPMAWVVIVVLVLVMVVFVIALVLQSVMVVLVMLASGGNLYELSIVKR